ncbi:MAG: alpha-glucosidase/alpha-galactosidase [Clostridiales bacterium]|nr:alpha-glucosidase/alpha-galactosidase [Clostridiales bacterium]
MSFKVTFIGAGSIGFTRALLQDLLSVPEFQSMEIAFMDIDQHNLDMVTQLCQRDIDANKLDIKIQSTLNRRDALKNAKYVFNVARIGGLEAFETDINIPLKYGIDQCVGDTLCAGGIMYGQRGISQILEFCADIKEVSRKDCMMFNYANPNAMMTWAANTYGKVPTIGLCHGVQGGHALIANALNLDQDEIDIICAGINHQTWYIQLKHNGEDLTDKLLEALQKHEEYSETEKVRIDMLKRFGYFSTESNGHLSEYLPWYRKRANDIENWIDLRHWANGETGGYLRVCTEGRNWFETDFPNWMKEDPKVYGEGQRGNEHGSYIIEGLETGRLYRGHFNVINNGCIDNLPDDAIVEVPGYVDANGINIPKVGALPLGCAAVCNASIQVQRMAVVAAVTGDDTLLKQAFMMDPLVGAVCNTPGIWQMVDEMLIAQQEWLPQYKKAIASAKKKVQSKDYIPVNDDYKGAARVKIKTIEEMRLNKEEAKKNAANAAK